MVLKTSFTASKNAVGKLAACGTLNRLNYHAFWLVSLFSMYILSEWGTWFIL